MNPPPSGRSLWIALGLCVVSAGTATVTTLMIGASSSPNVPAPVDAAPVRPSDFAQLDHDVMQLRQLVSELAARLTDRTTDPAAGSAERSPAASYALAADVESLSKRLAAVEGEIARLRDADPRDPRTELVASRRRKARARPEELEEIVAIRTERYGLDSTQSGRMREVEVKWQERDKVILAMWESGANLVALNRAIEQDEDAYQAEIEAILTPQQREQRRAEIATHGRSFVAR